MTRCVDSFDVCDVFRLESGAVFRRGGMSCIKGIESFSAVDEISSASIDFVISFSGIDDIRILSTADKDTVISSFSKDHITASRPAELIMIIGSGNNIKSFINDDFFFNPFNIVLISGRNYNSLVSAGVTFGSVVEGGFPACNNGFIFRARLITGLPLGSICNSSERLF